MTGRPLPLHWRRDAPFPCYASPVTRHRIRRRFWSHTSHCDMRHSTCDGRGEACAHLRPACGLLDAFDACICVHLQASACIDMHQHASPAIALAPGRAPAEPLPAMARAGRPDRPRDGRLVDQDAGLQRTRVRPGPLCPHTPSVASVAPGCNVGARPCYRPHPRLTVRHRRERTSWNRLAIGRVLII